MPQHSVPADEEKVSGISLRNQEYRIRGRFWTGISVEKMRLAKAARGNNAPKLLEKGGLDYDLSVIPAGYVIRLPKSARYAHILKNSVAFSEIANARISRRRTWPRSGRRRPWAQCPRGRSRVLRGYRSQKNTQNRGRRLAGPECAASRSCRSLALRTIVPRITKGDRRNGPDIIKIENQEI